jgi:hypothetical protein
VIKQEIHTVLMLIKIQHVNQKLRILKKNKNMIPLPKEEKLIAIKIILLNIEKLESTILSILRKIQNRLSARRVRGRK